MQLHSGRLEQRARPHTATIPGPERPLEHGLLSGRMMVNSLARPPLPLLKRKALHMCRKLYWLASWRRWGWPVRNRRWIKAIPLLMYGFQSQGLICLRPGEAIAGFPNSGNIIIIIFYCESLAWAEEIAARWLSAWTPRLDGPQRARGGSQGIGSGCDYHIEVRELGCISPAKSSPLWLWIYSMETPVGTGLRILLRQAGGNRKFDFGGFSANIL